MQELHWRTLACLQGTSKLKIGPAVAGRQVKETQSKKKGKEIKGDKRIMPDDIHVNINLVFVRSKYNYSRIERKKR